MEPQGAMVSVCVAFANAQKEGCQIADYSYLLTNKVSKATNSGVSSHIDQTTVDKFGV